MKTIQLRSITILGIIALILTGCITDAERKAHAEQEAKKRAEEAKAREIEMAQAFTNEVEKSWKDIENQELQKILALHDTYTNSFKELLKEKMVVENRMAWLPEREKIRIRGEQTEKESQLLKQWDWLFAWVDSRSNLTEADKLSGDALLEAFGTKLMPNAYARYVKARNIALEIQQVFNENFRQPWLLSSRKPEWKPYIKMLKRFIAIRTNYFRCRDELCHYYLMHRLGAITDSEVIDIDSRPICVWLQAENSTRIPFFFLELKPLRPEDEAFANKYLPESMTLYRKLKEDQYVCKKNMDDCLKEKYVLDAIRFERVMFIDNHKINTFTKLLNDFETKVRELNLSYKTMEITSENLAQFDHNQVSAFEAFMSSMSEYIRKQMQKPVIAEADLVAIPNMNFMMMRTEVTQRQWIQVMGYNPSNFIMPSDLPFTGVEPLFAEEKPLKQSMPLAERIIYNCSRKEGYSDVFYGYRSSSYYRENYLYYPGFNLPVENISWIECQEFIRRLNAMPITRESGLIFRLPTRDEWRYACRAGGPKRPTRTAVMQVYNLKPSGEVGKFGRRIDGKDGPLEEIGWYIANAQSSTHSVAKKIANAWGLYDMHGNVGEWCSDSVKGRDKTGIRLYVGGSFRCGNETIEDGSGWHGCTVDTVREAKEDYKDRDIGFRLVAEKIK